MAAGRPKNPIYKQRETTTIIGEVQNPKREINIFFRNGEKMVLNKKKYMLGLKFLTY